jgi:hypothetical protein
VRKVFFLLFFCLKITYPTKKKINLSPSKVIKHKPIRPISQNVIPTTEKNNELILTPSSDKSYQAKSNIELLYEKLNKIEREELELQIDIEQRIKYEQAKKERQKTLNLQVIATKFFFSNQNSDNESEDSTENK